MVPALCQEMDKLLNELKQIARTKAGGEPSPVNPTNSMFAGATNLRVSSSNFTNNAGNNHTDYGSLLTDDGVSIGSADTSALHVLSPKMGNLNQLKRQTDRTVSSGRSSPLNTTTRNSILAGAKNVQAPNSTFNNNNYDYTIINIRDDQINAVAQALVQHFVQAICKGAPASKKRTRGRFFC